MGRGGGMRFGSVGLSLLILAIATALAASPAGAADQGDVGVVENKVEIRASSTMEGED